MKRSLQDQHVLSRVLVTPEEYNNRHIKPADDDAEQVAELSKMKFIVYGAAAMVFGMLLMLFAKGCDREPMPAVVHGLNDIRCSVCHFDRLPALNTARKYKSYHQRKRPSVLVDNAKEQEYLVSLIVGDK